MFEYYVIKEKTIEDNRVVTTSLYAVGNEEDAKKAVEYLDRLDGELKVHLYKKKTTNIFLNVACMKKNLPLDLDFSRMGSWLEYYEVYKTQLDEQDNKWKRTDLKVGFTSEIEATTACSLFDMTSGDDRYFTYKKIELPIIDKSKNEASGRDLC